MANDDEQDQEPQKKRRKKTGIDDFLKSVQKEEADFIKKFTKDVKSELHKEKNKNKKSEGHQK